MHAADDIESGIERGEQRWNPAIEYPAAYTVGESIYIDSNMGHAYVTAEGCDEALVLGMCSSAEERLMESLLSMHGDTTASALPQPADRARPAVRPIRNRKR